MRKLFFIVFLLIAQISFASPNIDKLERDCIEKNGEACLDLGLAYGTGNGAALSYKKF